MRMKDVKTLWGRAANRCAFSDCKIELTIDGEIDTLGEMAHIIAKSPDGPRGKSDISSESRDSYENLILLCPTHHKIIDNSPEEWTVEKLKQTKEQHEKWVTEQLDKGAITIPSIDNSDFLNSRKKEWLNFSQNYVWIISSITPLNISEDAINPLESNFLDVLNSLALPQGISSNPVVNEYRTQPNEYGVGNEDLRAIQNGSGHRIYIFRNGHCEFSICLECATKKIADIWEDAYGEPVDGIVLFYSDVVDCFSYELKGLSSIWNGGLPFKDMLLTTLIINTSSTCLHYERRDRPWEPAIGSKISSDVLEYSIVISKTTDMKSTFESVIKRFVNYFGLVLENVFDENGNIVKPRKLF